MRQRTAASNSLRGLMEEFGLVAGKGVRRLGQLGERLAKADDTVVPLEGVRRSVAKHIDTLSERLKEMGR